MTTRPDAATRHVVERCPRCGVEHDVRVQECEACHAPLRYWCRAHGREAGWLDGPACARCAQEAARPRPPPSMRMPCPRPGHAFPGSLASPVAADASVAVAPAAAKPPKRFGPAGQGGGGAGRPGRRQNPRRPPSCTPTAPRGTAGDACCC